MKKRFFIIVTLILSMQYCFAIGANKKVAEIKPTSFQTQINKLQKNADFTVESSTIIAIVTENENSFEETSQFQFSTFKNNPDTFSTYLKLIETVYSSTYNQYTSAFYNFPIKFKKANLIFPFHYFW